MVKVTTNDIDNKKVCTYMEVLKKHTEKINEIIEVINKSNVLPTWHYNIVMSGSNFYVSFDVYTHIEMDAGDIGEFVENYQENFSCSCVGLINDALTLNITYNNDNQTFVILDIENTDNNITLNDITDSKIIVKEI